LGGYHFWSYKTDQDPWGDWDFKKLVDDGIYPKNLNCWPVDSCAPTRRQWLKDYALSKQTEERATGVASHQAYWRRTAPNDVYDWDVYLDGFDAGYTTAIRFHHSSASRVAMKKELAAWRTKVYTQYRDENCLETSNAWQFRDGFLEGLAQLEAVYANAPASNSN